MQTGNTKGAIHGVVTAATIDVAATNPNQPPAPKKRARTDATAKAVKVGKTWTARLRRSGHDVYETGHKTRADAELAAARELAKRKSQSDPFGKGPKKTSFALALRDYATAKLPYMKGAKQEISRINVYLRLAKLPTIKVIPVEGKHVRFKVEFEQWTSERAVPKGLHAHRKQLVVKTADSMRLRAVLATKMVGGAVAHLPRAISGVAAKRAGHLVRRHRPHRLHFQHRLGCGCGYGAQRQPHYPPHSHLHPRRQGARRQLRLGRPVGLRQRRCR